VDKKREVLLVDTQTDANLAQMIQFLSELIPTMSSEQQVKAIALAVAKQMGGPVPEGQIAEFNVKFKISELKLQLNSNVIPIGHITQGTFYHRALLFKVICDRLGLKPCTLARGDYGRAWNLVDVKSQSLNVKPVVRNPRPPTSNRPKSQGANGQNQAAAPIVAPPSIQEQKLQYLGCAEVDAEPFPFDEQAIVDLMFQPGKLILADSIEAERYKRVLDFE
jgi:hypothetical protein